MTWLTIRGFPIGISDLVDIAATAILTYYLLLLISGTRAVRIVLGLLFLVVLLGLANTLHLLVLTTILRVPAVPAARSMGVLVTSVLPSHAAFRNPKGVFSCRRQGAGITPFSVKVPSSPT